MTGAISFAPCNIITDSLSVSIGPLEHCGVGHIIYIGPNAYVAVCKGDPMIPEYHEKHFLSRLDRVGSHLDTTGKYKRARSQQELRRLVKKAHNHREGIQTSRSGSGGARS
ncbi:hypothetical protein B0H10DRAFT_2027819 [Mycena sp. CBHHK59/15]|nr:hypothetical protein B0H10DRAFT_2027819 [Mycena sp. CBHHK59/15]